MSVLSPSQQSTSTFCSEFEHIGSTKQKWSDVSHTQQGKPPSKSTISQNIRSSRCHVSPSIFSQDYTQRSSLFPLSQKSRPNKTTYTASTKPELNGSRSKDVYKVYDRLKNKVKSVTNVAFANKMLSKYPRNRIFDTENKYRQASTKVSLKEEFNTDNFDTISITSEAVSKIVDKEIELHRMRKQKRILFQSQLPKKPAISSNNTSYCPCLDYHKQYKPAHVASDRLKTNAYVPLRSKLVSTSSSKMPSKHEAKEYKLTKGHINKLAAIFFIDETELISAIEKVIIDNNLESALSDTESEIKCSQSPIRRRYTSSQSTSFSNTSR